MGTVKYHRVDGWKQWGCGVGRVLPGKRETVVSLALAPTGDSWESKMVEYPHVVREGHRLRLFYCGNGYGATGIGTALADPLSM